MRPSLAASGVLGLVALGACGALPAVAAPAPQVGTCSGVWVVVTSRVQCATSYGDGLTALRSAGNSVETNGGLVCRIGGIPDTCTATFSGYWSYWHAHRRSDGSFGAWSYSTKGASQYHPTRGDAEGWVFGDGSTPPGTLPPTNAPTAPATTSAAGGPGGIGGVAPPRSFGTTTARTNPANGQPVASATAAGASVADAVTPTPSDAASDPGNALPVTPAASDVTGTQPSAGASGPAVAFFSLGALALGGVGVGWSARRRRNS